MIAPGYYLYAKKLQISLIPNNLLDTRLPQGDFQYDQIRGRYEAYSGVLTIPILLRSSSQQTELNIDYQGCSRDGFCYPPMQAHFLLNVSDQIVTKVDHELLTKPSAISLQSLLTNQQGIQSLLEQQYLGVILIIFFGLGLLLAMTPCIWPMVPILGSIIVGQKQSGTWKSFVLSLTYVLGMALTYALAGLLAVSLGKSLQVWLQTPWMIAWTSVLFVLLPGSLF